MLAPIEDITSNSFRTICHKYGADLTFTEMVKIGGLASNNKGSWSRLELKDETPTVIQLLGVREVCFKRFLDMFEPQRGFKGFNLNLGCPNPAVISDGQGCAMVRRTNKTNSIVKIFKDRGYPISVKLRLGRNKLDKEKKVYINLIKGVDADFFIVHTRHGQQTYADPADFSVYSDCVKTGKEIIANGDIKSKEQIDYLKETGVRGAMIGRAAVLDPTIFNKLKGLSSPPLKEVLSEYSALSDKFGEAQKYSKNVMKHVLTNAQG